MLFQVFYMYSITTKNKYLPGDVPSLHVMSSRSLLLAPRFSSSLSPPPPPPLMCFHVLTPLLPPGCLSGCSWKATVGPRAGRAAWWSTEQTSAPRTWTTTTACASAPSCSLEVRGAAGVITHPWPNRRHVPPKCFTTSSWLTAETDSWLDVYNRASTPPPPPWIATTQSLAPDNLLASRWQRSYPGYLGFISL